MKISSTSFRQIEQYVANELTPGNRLLFQARLILDPALRQAVALHRQTLILTKAYARAQQRKQLNTLHQQLFAHPTQELRQTRSLFSR